MGFFAGRRKREREMGTSATNQDQVVLGDRKIGDRGTGVGVMTPALRTFSSTARECFGDADSKTNSFARDEIFRMYTTAPGAHWRDGNCKHHCCACTCWALLSYMSFCHRPPPPSPCSGWLGLYIIDQEQRTGHRPQTVRRG